METKTKFTYFLLKLVNAKKLVLKSLLKPKRSKKFSYPRRLRKYHCSSFKVHNRAVVTFASNKTVTNKHIVFLHGGAYTAEVKSGHWWMVEQIIRNIPYKLSFIQYPLAPEYSYRQTHTMLAEAYSLLIAKNQDDVMYLLGDSAGGGLCLAFAQTLRENGQRQPKKIALLSPWVDLSMSNSEIKEMEQKDLLLSANTLKKFGRLYASGLDTMSPILSPLFGNMNDLENVAIFVGTHEIFLPDCRLLKQKIEHSNTALYYKEYNGMQHDWMLFPIKERYVLLKDLIHYLQA